MSEANGHEISKHREKKESGNIEYIPPVEHTNGASHNDGEAPQPSSLTETTSDISKPRSSSTKSKRRSKQISKRENKSNFVPKVVDDVKIGDAKIRYQLVGASNSKELVICLHGLTTYSAHFAELREYLVKRRRRQTLLFDFFGRGDSTCPSGKQDVQFFVKQLEQLLLKLKLDQLKFVLIGHNLGGAVAAQYALKHPHKVAYLILMAPLGMPADYPWTSGFTVPLLGEKLWKKSNKDWFAIQPSDFWDPEGHKEIFELATQQSHKQIVLNTFFEKSFMSTIKMESDYTQLGEKGIPILLLWGEKDTLLPSETQRRQFEKCLPGAIFYAVPNAGHLAFLEQPEVVQKTIKLFLRGKLVSTPHSVRKVSHEQWHERYLACMTLAAAADAIGFKNGIWQHEQNGKALHQELKKIGGVHKIDVNQKNWRVSDDTVMHLATAESLVSEWNGNLETLYSTLAEKYLASFKDMSGRNPGIQCGKAQPYLAEGMVSSTSYSKEAGRWNKIPFHESGVGYGAASRSMCIGLWYHRPDQANQLIKVAVESSRMTHNHPVGIMGGVCAAVFTSYAIQGRPIAVWGRKLLKYVIPKVKQYLEKTERDLSDYKHLNNEDISNLEYFELKWTDYLTERRLLDSKKPVFPEPYSVFQREKYYASLAYSGSPAGSSGHDSVMIAYDALLASGDNWEEFIARYGIVYSVANRIRAAIHGGTNDTTGSIGAAWFGAIYGFHNVPACNYQNLEYKERIQNAAEQLCNQSGVYEFDPGAYTAEKRQQGSVRRSSKSSSRLKRATSIVSTNNSNDNTEGKNEETSQV